MDQTSQDLEMPADLTLMQKMKIYGIEVVLRKVGPAAIGSAVSLAAAFILAHQNAFESYGINYIQEWSPEWLATHTITGKVLLLELDTTSLQAISGIIALAVAFFVTGGHHISAAVTGKPQSGGQRATDQPPAPPSVP